MEFIRKQDLSCTPLPGRHIWKAIGKDSAVYSTEMTIGFAKFSAEIGSAEAHQHAEECIYIIKAQKAFIRWGKTRETLNQQNSLIAGTLLHIPAEEWHQFFCEEGGFCELLFFYGVVNNIRPEDKKD